MDTILFTINGSFRNLAIFALSLQRLLAINNTLIIPRTPDYRMCTVHLKSFSGSQEARNVTNSILHSNQGTVLWTIWSRNSSIIVQPTIDFHEPYSIYILLQHLEFQEPETYFLVSKFIVYSKYTYMNPRNSIYIIVRVASWYFIPDVAYILPLQIYLYPGMGGQAIRNDNNYPRYVFIPNRFLGNMDNSFTELPSSHDMFDKLGIHNLVTKTSRDFSVCVDAPLPDKNTLSCLKTSWELSPMTGKLNERCYFVDYLLNTFQEVINMTYYFPKLHVIQNLAAFKIGILNVQTLVDEFNELDNNMLSRLGDVSMEILYCEDSVNFLKKYRIFVTAFDLKVWALLLLSIAAGSLILSMNAVSNARLNYLNLLRQFMTYCFKIICVVLEQGVKERKLGFLGFSLTTAFLLNVYKSEIFKAIVLNPIPSEILSISHLLEDGYVIHMQNERKSLDWKMSMYNATKIRISRNLEAEIWKKFEVYPKRYLDSSNGPDGIKDLRRVFKTSSKYALLLIGDEPHQNAFLHRLKLAFAPQKFCSRTKTSVQTYWRFAKFFNPIFINLKILSSALHESGFIPYWNTLVNHMHSLLREHLYSQLESSASDLNLNKDDLINLQHLYPVMITFLCCFVFSSLVLVFEIVGQSNFSLLTCFNLENKLQFCIPGAQRLVGNLMKTVKSNTKNSQYIKQDKEGGIR
jgi:hypothetical protein